ncbi:ubiquitin carboxyl-terminal hydrolase 17-like protein B [Meriones unguiculatus]|uniref:ubiquitin carboxyl-terminal hydrolase 17-like protein B n=1 Tax=Meriones unguiculatus TaxID=10047 RepID=UPI000B4FB481|nr:ubiquitin carboxyl-terminal hydrolase 17-like protein B [Meriones unguiculatus]
MDQIDTVLRSEAILLQEDPVVFSPAVVTQHQSKAQMAEELADSGTHSPSWEMLQDVGAGLQNIGNSCYLNAALQCLTHTPPLASYLLSGEHSQSCCHPEDCWMCAMEAHVIHSFFHSRDVMQPSRKLTAAFHKSQQEDAHEFLMFTLNAMHESCLLGSTSMEPDSKDSTLVPDIFGGSWRSQIECLHCQGTSDSFDPFLDIPLDIRMAQSVKEALENLVEAEELCGDNAYYCHSCQEKTPALKTLTVQTAPKVLLLVLNRFSGFTFDKVDSIVSYPEFLDLQPYMSRPSRRPLMYALYAVLVHNGASCHSGHYFCYVKAGNGKWYKMDDSRVTSCNVTSVLSEPAYVLFYVQQTDLKKDSVNAPVGRVNKALSKQGPESQTWQKKLNTESCIQEREEETRDQRKYSVTREISLDQWKVLQEQNRPYPVLNLRKIQPTLPANAVVIHPSRHKEDRGRAAPDKENFPCPSAAKLLNVQDPMNPGQLCSQVGRRKSKKKRKNKQEWGLLTAY